MVLTIREVLLSKSFPLHAAILPTTFLFYYVDLFLGKILYKYLKFCNSMFSCNFQAFSYIMDSFLFGVVFIPRSPFKNALQSRLEHSEWHSTFSSFYYRLPLRLESSHGNVCNASCTNPLVNGTRP